MIKLLICEDQTLVRESLIATLALEEDVTVVGEAINGAEAVEMVGALGPDVVLMDIQMPVMDGIEATRRITADHPEVKVIILTTHSAEKHVLDSLRSGATGYALKDSDGSDLVQIIKLVKNGGRYIEPSLASEAIFELARGMTYLEATRSRVRRADEARGHNDHTPTSTGYA